MVEASSRFKIVIVGGGIGGLASAIALRGKDREILVLEQSRLNKEIGATLSLQPNASKIVEQTWGLRDVTAKIGMRDEGFQIFGTDGTLQRSIPLKTSSYGADRMVYHRQDLHSALKVAATTVKPDSPKVEIMVSSHVTKCDPDSGTVYLEDGSAITADLIVGADGIKSVLREHVTGRKVSATPTGLSAYRLMVQTSDLERSEKEFCDIINPRSSMTTMIMAYDRRLIMGPARDGTVYSAVALIPDERKSEDTDNSWTSRADLDAVLRDFEKFPHWAKAPFRHCDDIGLWQLRDIEPLQTWYRGRVILVGDAAHAMLPTQGQGASQAIEDAEALGAFFADVEKKPSYTQVNERLETIWVARHERATTIQSYSRQSAQPATAKDDVKINMNPAEFMDYNCRYTGAKNWLGLKHRTAGDTSLQDLAVRLQAVDVN